MEEVCREEKLRAGMDEDRAEAHLKSDDYKRTRCLHYQRRKAQRTRFLRRD